MSTSKRRSQLHRLIRARRWDEVTSHLERNGPDEATHRDGTGTNALHLACGRDPPIGVVEALIVAHPGATSEQDSLGSTPLTVACQQGRDVSVGVVRALLEHDPGSARMRDAWGGSSLDAVYNGEGFTSARERILRRDAAGNGGSADGSTSMAAVTTATPGDAAAGASSDVFSSDDSPMDDDDFRDGWEKLCLILAADYHGSVSSVSIKTSSPAPPVGGGGTSWRVVHACAGVTYAPCLPGLLKLAVTLHPEQVREVDEGGRLPLHVLLSNPRLLTFPDGGMIDPLIERYPAAAGIPDGTTGRLPLHAAVDRSLSWQDEVKSIYRAAPYVVRVRDVDTGLFPFMLAAVGDSSCIDAVFELLRAFPELRAFSRCQQSSQS